MNPSYGLNVSPNIHMESLIPKSYTDSIWVGPLGSQMRWLYKKRKGQKLAHCFVLQVTPSSILWCSMRPLPNANGFHSPQNYRQTYMSTLWTCFKPLLSMLWFSMLSMLSTLFSRRHFLRAAKYMCSASSEPWWLGDSSLTLHTLHIHESYLQTYLIHQDSMK